MSQRTIDLSPYRDLDLKSVTMRTVSGEDTLAAAARCIPADGNGVDGNLFGVMMRQQSMAQAIVAYHRIDSASATSCSGPCVESVSWSARTREFIGEIFDHMNGLPPEEREGFRKALAGGAAASKPSSPT